MKMNKKAILLLCFFMLLGICFLTYYYYTYMQSPRRLPVFGNPGHVIAPFSFTDQEGHTVTEKDMQDKIYIVEYFFTTCEGICPTMNENLNKVYQAYKGQQDICILSHTVDPETDSIAQLKKYALKFDADPKQWHFLTGQKKELYTMAVESYLLSAMDDTVKKILPDFIHNQHFVLIDKDKRIRGTYDGTDIEKVQKLIKDIAELQKEYKH